MKRARAILFLLALSMFSALGWADHADQIEQVRIEGSGITVYGRFIDAANTQVLFSAADSPYQLQPRVTNASTRAIELQLPFPPVPGEYRLTFKEPGKADLDLAITIGENGVSTTAMASDSTSDDGRVSTGLKGDSAMSVNINTCRGAAESCDSPILMSDDSPFCSAVADFDPYRGSQAITIDGTQELYLDESYSVEARIYTRGYVRSGILLDKYSGNGRGREYRLSVNREGLLRSWFSVDGTLNNIRVLYSDTPVPKNEWVHVATTYDGQVMRLFIGGDMVAEKAMRGRPAQLGYQNIAIGGNNCCDGYYEVFNGLIDEVRISSIVRYRENFTPPAEQFIADEKTLLLLSFDEQGKNLGVVGGAAQLTGYNRIVPCSDL